MHDLPRPPATRKARATYDALVAATRAELQHGVLSPEAIAERARVSPATFYTYFSSKDEVLAVALDQALAETTALLDEALSIEHLLEHGLEPTTDRIVDATIRGYRRDVGTLQLALIRAEESEVIQKVLAHWRRVRLEALSRFIHLGQRAGKIRQGETDRIATAMLITLQGYKSTLLLESADSALDWELASMLTALLQPEARAVS